MGIFDNEKGQIIPSEPGPFDGAPHLIHIKPLEVDLAQPNRISAEDSQKITSLDHSKLVADIFTPEKHFSVMYIDGVNEDNLLMLAGDTQNVRILLEQGGEVDVSDEGDDRKCIIEFSEDGKSTYVRSEKPDAGYCIFTRTIQATDAPTFANYNDDPDFPDEGIL